MSWGDVRLATRLKTSKFLRKRIAEFLYPQATSLNAKSTWEDFKREFPRSTNETMISIWMEPFLSIDVKESAALLDVFLNGLKLKCAADRSVVGRNVVGAPKQVNKIIRLSYTFHVGQ